MPADIQPPAEEGTVAGKKEWGVRRAEWGQGAERGGDGVGGTGGAGDGLIGPGFGGNLNLTLFSDLIPWHMAMKSYVRSLCCKGLSPGKRKFSICSSATPPQDAAVTISV